MKCECPTHYSHSTKGCLAPKNFLLFGQKNKVSRLLYSDDDRDPLPDVSLPIHGSRDIRAMSFDPVDQLLYWIDYGSKRKESSRVSIKRAFTNGTLLDRLLQEEEDDLVLFQPTDLAVDPISRVLFWTSRATHSINVTQLERGKEARSASLLSGPTLKPTKIALHPSKG